MTIASRFTGLLVAGAVSLTAALTLGACGGDDSSSSSGSSSATTFVGDVAGTQLAVAAVVQGDKVIAYVCDGHNGSRMDGTLKGGQFDSTLEGGTLSFDVKGDALKGALVLNGSTYQVSATKASGKAALLWAKSTKDATPISAGWIVRPDGSETGGVVAGIRDGSSGLVPTPSALPHVEQDNIIAILIGLRSPLP